ncbi:MAG: hypothetical protein LUQ04_10615 [Methanoregula sp.]|nr:hypothetical protein [Methanoregula sp.]
MPPDPASEDRNQNGSHRENLSPIYATRRFGHTLPLHIKYGLKWRSRFNSGVLSFWAVTGNRPYWSDFDHVFSDNRFAGVESGITDYNGRETGLFIPFWEAKLIFCGLEYR